MLPQFIKFVLVLLVTSSWVFAGFSEMGRRFPGDTNAVVAINLESLMQTPMAIKEEWPQRWTSLYEAGPISIPPGTARVLSASRLLRDLESAHWQISLMEVKEPVSLQEIARNTGGTTESLWNKQGVVTPSRQYIVRLDDAVLAAIDGADRQFAVTWIREAKTSGPDSDVIKGVIQALGNDSHVVLALDLRDQYSAAEIRKAMEMEPFKTPGDADADIAALSETLAGIQSLQAQIRVTETAEARVALQFGVDVASMQDYAKPLLIEILNRNGFALPEAKEWKVEVADKRVTLTGNVSRQSLRNILGFITGPLPAYGAGQGAESSEDPAVIAKTSQAYFRAVSAILDSYGGGTNYSEAAGWLRKESERIDRLSILNVDPALATWGAQCAAQMREASSMMKADQMSSVAAMQGVSSAGATYSSDYNTRQYNRERYREAMRERARVISEKKAESAKKATQLLSGLMVERSKLRVQLTQQYGVAF